MTSKARRTSLFLTLLVPGVVAAQRPDGPPRLVLQALDADRNGKLSAAEIRNAPTALLTLDHNADGQLTIAELQPPPEKAGATPDELVHQLMAFDKNGDGVLNPDELPVRMQTLFARADADHDGKLTPAEIRTMASHQAMPAGNAPANLNLMRSDPILAALDTDHDGVLSAAEIASAGQSLLSLDKNGDGELTPDEIRPRQQTPQERVDHMLDEWDTNKDGKIAKAEAPDRMQQQFESIDTNHDGFLDHDELTQYFSAMGNPTPRPTNTDAPKGDPR